MKIALFAAVEEEIKSIKDRVHLTGIGRECATEAMLQFIQERGNEDFTIMNIGTTGAHSLPVGSLVRITEIVSGGAQFLDHPMLTDRLPIDTPETIDGKLFSSDCFVSPHVYSADFLQHLKETADCFDMESSSLFSIAHHYRKPYVSFKIVSDNLDVDIDEWHRRVVELSKNLCVFMEKLIGELSENEPVEFIK